VFARPPELHPQEHDLVAIVRQVVDLEQVTAEQRGVVLALDADPPQVLAEIDVSKVHQLVQNLVRNACEAVSAGGHVTTGVRVDDARCVIRVSDDGPGIPDHIVPRIYEPFFSTKEGGTGLGMSIVHSLVSLHAARSTSGPAPPAPRSRSRSRGGGDRAQRGIRSRLCAGGQALRWFRADGRTTPQRGARGGRQRRQSRACPGHAGGRGLPRPGRGVRRGRHRSVRARPARLRAARIQMPGMDGVTACRRIRELPGGADVPIVFLTAQRDVDTFDRA
jgi:anti-sigma regulatory factor (Ser/Thr protein kinase)